jgi:hypothetical protein
MSALVTAVADAQARGVRVHEFVAEMAPLLARHPAARALLNMTYPFMRVAAE